MSRIDVVRSEKGFAVLVNFIRRGVVYHSPEIANQEAKRVHKKMPHAEIHLLESEKVS